MASPDRRKPVWVVFDADVYLRCALFRRDIARLNIGVFGAYEGGRVVKYIPAPKRKEKRRAKKK